MPGPHPNDEPSRSPQSNSLSESVLLLERFQSGDDAAATELFERFSQRLASLVQSRLSRKLARRLDAEDVVSSAYRSFFVRARDGQFSVDEPGDLWRLLAQMTLNKLYRGAARHNADRRSLNREQHDVFNQPNQIADVATAPELEVIVADQLEYLMAQLPEATGRVLELRLQGNDVEEIAALVGRSSRTVRRQLETIRTTFLKSVGNEPLGDLNRKPSFQTQSLNAADTDAGPTELTPVCHGVQVRTLDDFVLRRQIGLGLTGRVYEAFDKRHQRLVAVKVLRKALISDRSLRERFENEVSIVAQLSHPGIVRIEGHGETPNRGRFIVMELFENGDLTKFAGKSLPTQRAVEWLLEASAAIAYAHKAGVIHCDLKPANMLLSADNHVAVADFGFAQLKTALPDQRSFIAGTPSFMAPEQVDSTWGQIGPHTDIYGLGAVMYFLLTGSAPINGATTQDILSQLTAKSDIPSVEILRPNIPDSVSNIIDRSLRKDPKQRIESVETLIALLRSDAKM